MTEISIPLAETQGSPVIIDRAAPDDAEAIMTIKRDAWLATYVNEEHGVTVDDINKKLSDVDMQIGIENWQLGIASEAEGSDRATFVARMNGKVVGYTSPCIEEGQRRLGAMYVTPSEHGHGVGAKLISKALEWHGPHDVFAHVVSYNDKAIGFYEHFGFQKTGKEFPEEFDAEKDIKLLPEIEMVHRAAQH